MEQETLNEFLNRTDGLGKERRYVSSRAWVREAGFESLYVRRACHRVGGEMRETIDLASLTAETPGRGAFAALVAKLRRDRPALTIYVESVMTDRFSKGLVRMGFLEAGPSAPSCFYYPGDRS